MASSARPSALKPPHKMPSFEVEPGKSLTHPSSGTPKYTGFKVHGISDLSTVSCILRKVDNPKRPYLLEVTTPWSNTPRVFAASTPAPNTSQHFLVFNHEYREYRMEALAPTLEFFEVTALPSPPATLSSSNSSNKSVDQANTAAPVRARANPKSKRSDQRPATKVESKPAASVMKTNFLAKSEPKEEMLASTKPKAEGIAKPKPHISVEKRMKMLKSRNQRGLTSPVDLEFAPISRAPAPAAAPLDRSKLPSFLRATPPPPSPKSGSLKRPAPADESSTTTTGSPSKRLKPNSAPGSSPVVTPTPPPPAGAPVARRKKPQPNILMKSRNGLPEYLRENKVRSELARPPSRPISPPKQLSPPPPPAVPAVTTPDVIDLAVAKMETMFDDSEDEAEVRDDDSIFGLDDGEISVAE